MPERVQHPGHARGGPEHGQRVRQRRPEPEPVLLAVARAQARKRVFVFCRTKRKQRARLGVQLLEAARDRARVQTAELDQPRRPHAAGHGRHDEPPLGGTHRARQERLLSSVGFKDVFFVRRPLHAVPALGVERDGVAALLCELFGVRAGGDDHCARVEINAVRGGHPDRGPRIPGDIQGAHETHVAAGPAPNLAAARDEPVAHRAKKRLGVPQEPSVLEPPGAAAHSAVA
mmetsp:Transcript_10497/g.43996  ORF Transcript_10497/g.43996 Transcript_10497/m.43996 type:complete len:231 (-) Transcript_10497:725-1417(-)